MNIRQAEKKYLNDPYFKQVVDLLVSQVIQLKTSPSELREMAMFAAIRAESLAVRPIPFENIGDTQ